MFSLFDIFDFILEEVGMFGLKRRINVVMFGFLDSVCSV